MVAVMTDGGPVLVEFYLRAVKDNAASIESGHYVAKDVETIKITPQGGNLVWSGKVTDEHRQRYAPQYEAWQKGIEIPEEGQPLREWPPISPAQLKTLDAVHIRTVEALAVATDGTIQHGGMGVVALRAKARAWLESASEHGQLAEKLSVLEVQVRDLLERNEQLTEANQKLANKPAPAKKRSAA